MVQRPSPDASETSASRAPVAGQLIEEPLWHTFIGWMRIHGNLDPDCLAQDIQKQMMLNRTNITEGGSGEALALREIFSRALIFLGIFDAAISNPRGKQVLQSLTAQIQQHFPDEWTNLCEKINPTAVKKLQDTARTLIGQEKFRRKPNVIIDTFRPRLLGTRSFDMVAGQGVTQRTGESDSLGAPLYKTTVQSSSRAFVTAVQMRSELESLPEEDEAVPAQTGPADREQAAVEPKSPPHEEAV